jgi:hypothetical protein
VVTRANGSRADVHDARRGMDVHNSLNGNRISRVERPDHSRVVSERGGRGYVQRPYAFRGHEFAHRTYYVHGRAYDRFYRSYSYHGFAMEVYAPARYYPVGYYGWAYNPWAVPVAFAWGFGPSPWYGYYGPYFAPAPVYPSASYWLADYMLSQDLQNAYQAGVDAGQRMQPLAAAGPTPLTPDVKAQIAQEVQKQIALENQEATLTAQNKDVDPNSSGIARVLGEGNHVFVVGHDMDLVDAGGNECMVTPGDVLQLRAAQPNATDAASLIVLASKPAQQECGKASTVQVALTDLQDMQNAMRETVDQGLGELQAKQGKGGLPAAPAGAAGPATPAPFTQGAPPPEPNIATEIAQQAQEADRADADAAQLAQGGSGPSDTTAGPPKEISLGMTQQQVIATMGPPSSIVALGPTKKMIVYKDMKVMMTDGKVVDIK